MARDPLNYFEPYESLPPHHENQLTRALVVVLRLSPIAHSAWLRRVVPDRALYDLPQVDWRVQRRDIVPTGGEVSEDLAVVSVFLSGERADEGGDVVESERGQILDAIALYGRELAVVVENKITGSPDDRQARRLNVGGLTVQLGTAPVRIPWRDLLDDLGEILRLDLVSGAEAGVIEDFLEYTEAYFDHLMPFNKLSLCRGSSYRQERRLRVILTDATGAEARPGRDPSIPLAGATAVERAYLKADGDEFVLNLWLGDTLSQARNLYRRPDAVDGVLRLHADGWRLRHNFHFGFMGTGYTWTKGSIAPEDYLRLFEAEIATAHQLPRDEWDEYWAWLEKKEIARPDDRHSFDRHFVNTRRNQASPRPGVLLSRTWSIDEAEALDDRHGLFVMAVREAIVEALRSIGEDGVASEIERATKVSGAS
jgi:hypothetical protein